MQVSISEKYPGYVLNAIYLEVKLDGVKQWRCLAADDVAGTVTRYVVNETGNIVVDPMNQNECLVETVHGKVEIITPEHWSPMYPKDFEPVNCG